MKTIVLVYIHEGSTRSFRGKDFRGYKEFDVDNLAENFIQENYFNVDETYIDSELGFKLIYLKSIAYNQRCREMEHLFIEGYPKEATLYSDKQEVLDNLRRKEEGFVRHGEDSDYNGKLKKCLTKEVVEYMDNKVLFGYLGHSFRKLEHDEAIEEIIDCLEFKLDNKEIDKWECIGVWLTSSGARHFMDSVEGYSLEAFRETINENAICMVTRGFVYNLPNHGGSMDDTLKLMNDYENKITMTKNSEVI